VLHPGTALAKYDIEFLPRVEVRAESVGNARGTDGGPNDGSDVRAELTLSLALQGQKPRKNWRVSYQPARQNFDDASEFDNTSHRLDGSFSQQVSDLSTYALQFSGSRTRNGGRRSDGADPASAEPRAETDRLSATLVGQTQVSTKTFLNWNLRGSLVDREDLPGEPLADSETIGVNLGWGRSLSEKSSIAIEVGQQEIDYDARASNETTELRANYSRSLSRSLSTQVLLGVIETETGTEDRTAPRLDVSLNRSDGVQTMRVGIRQYVSSGTGQTSATIDSGAFGNWSISTRDQKFRLGVGATYWYRESVETLQGVRPGTENIRTNTDFNWQVRKGLSLGLSHRYNKQNSIETGSTTVATYEADYHSGGAYVRWAPGTGR
jgi:hypothetical protein